MATPLVVGGRLIVRLRLSLRAEDGCWMEVSMKSFGAPEEAEAGARGPVELMSSSRGWSFGERYERYEYEARSFA